MRRPMSSPSSLRSALPLCVGLVVGALGAGFFLTSRPGIEGSTEARAQKLEADLRQAQTRIAALEETKPRSSRLPTQTVFDRGREIAQRLRDGRPVSSDDLYQAIRPLLRDFSPLFERMMDQQARREADTRIGELARIYDLTPGQQETLKGWFRRKAEADHRRWSDVVGRDDSRYLDMVKALRSIRPDEGLDAVMEGMLSGTRLETFKAERLEQRAQRVQQYADLQVQRINDIVHLDAAQTDQLFGIMAQSSPDYDPSIRLEGATGEITPTGLKPRDALLTILRPDQRAAYEDARQRRFEEISHEMSALGISLPDNWDELEFEP